MSDVSLRPLEEEYPIELGGGVRAGWGRVSSDSKPTAEVLWLWFEKPCIPIMIPVDAAGALYNARGAQWIVHSMEPLTLTPSVRVCDGSGVTVIHGWITDGKWVEVGDAKPWW